MGQNTICLIIYSQITQCWLCTLISRCHGTRPLLLWHVRFNEKRSCWQDIYLSFILHLNCTRQKVVISLGRGISRHIRDWMLSREWGYVYDCTPIFSFQHFGYQKMRHHRHWDYINIYLIHDFITRNLVEISDVRNPYIIHQDGHIQVLKFFEYPGEEICLLAQIEVCNNVLSFYLLFFVNKPNFIKCLLHFIFVSGNHAYVEPQIGKFFAKS